MDLQLHNNYVYTRQLDLNLDEQQRSAHMMYEFIKHTFADKDHNGQSTMIYNLYEKYNYFMYSVPGIHKLYNGIKETFHQCNIHRNGENDREYFAQCWLNFYHKGEFIDWHGHWPEKYDTWHGFYCVDVEPDSKTTYRFSDQEVDIQSKNNLLVISPSAGDEHRSSEWNFDRPRITIAFDIIPADQLFELGSCFSRPNHWVPI
jgi:hypothetical protein